MAEDFGKKSELFTKHMQTLIKGADADGNSKLYFTLKSILTKYNELHE